ncbi:MAG: hypothetical protein Kow00124_28990 [Anaerolineae bacterium]
MRNPISLSLLLVLAALILSGCLVETPAAPTETPFAFVTATPRPTSTPTPVATATLTPTPLMPFLAQPGTAVPTFGPSPTPSPLATPTIPGVSGHPCPHRLTGDFLRVYVREPGIELSMGCPTNRDAEMPIQLWPVTVRYQPFERGLMLWLSNRGWEESSVVYVLRQDQIYARYPDRFNPQAPPTATPPADAAPANPQLNPPPGLSVPSGALGYLWLNEPAVYEQLGFATGPLTVVETEMLMLEYGELLRMPGLGVMLAFKQGNPGTWTEYALP